MLRVRGLRAGYGASVVLQGVDLDVEAGTVIALMGRNGMGKSTLLRALMGLLPVTGGSVLFNQRDITALAPYEIARLGLALVAQGREIFAALSVEDNLRLAVIGRPRARRRSVPAAVYDWFPVLAARRSQVAGTLSGGEQQMLAIGRALAAEPLMLLLDEPTEGLQPSVVHDIGITLARIAADAGLTVLVVEQNVDLVMTVAASVAFMDNGIIAEVVPSGTIAADESVLARHLLL